MKAHRSNRSNRPVNRSNRSVNRSNRSEPVAWEFLNLFEFGFEFNRFPPVTGLTGPVNRYRRAAVRPVRSDFKTLVVAEVLVLVEGEGLDVVVVEADALVVVEGLSSC